MRPAILAILLVGLSACEQEGTKRPVGDADADVDGDVDADADADGDVDADGDADGDVTPTGCGGEGDCVVAIQLDLCCACPRAVNRRFEAAEQCLEPWPVDGTPPEACAVECGVCEPCDAPDGAVCVEGDCALRFPGACVTADDCDAGEICVVVDAGSRCDPDPTLCDDNEQCTYMDWCALTDDGLRRCRPLPPGGCVLQRHCLDLEQCVGATEDQPGQCEPRK